VGHAGGLDGPDDLRRVEGDPPELDCHAAVDGEERVLGRMVGARVTDVLEVVDRQPDAAGVHVIRVAEPPRPLLVGVAACEHGRVLVGERRAEVGLLHPGSDDRVPRAGRAVEGEQRTAAAEVEPDRRLEAAMEFELGVGELRLGPARGVQLGLGRLLLAGVERQEEVVGVAVDGRTAELPDELQALRGLRPALGVVAEADHCVVVLLGKVVQHRAERDPVPVDVREEGDSH
jgi:hypothetical protein